MGAGKTAVGELLAKKLNLPFADLDDVIEKKTDLSIPLIFEKHGENYFRELEKDTLQRISQYPGNVIATGGGIILSTENRKTMKNTGITVYLKWHTEILYQRIKNCTQRPLVEGIEDSQLFQHVDKLLKARLPFYEKADIIIEGNEKTSPEEIVNILIQKLPLN